jgi:hypothetical protein
VPGVIYVNCCSRNDLESEHIAWVSMEHIWLLNEEIEQAGIFDVGRDLYIAEPAPASSLVSGNQGEEWYCTAVQVPVLFPRTSSVSPLDGGLAERVEMRTSGAGEQSSRVEDKPTFGSSERVGSGGGADGSSGRAESPHGRMTVPKRFPGGPLGV